MCLATQCVGTGAGNVGLVHAAKLDLYADKTRFSPSVQRLGQTGKIGHKGCHLSHNERGA